jgi:hypothetical protein
LVFVLHFKLVIKTKQTATVQTGTTKMWHHVAVPTKATILTACASDIALLWRHAAVILACLKL